MDVTNGDVLQDGNGLFFSSACGGGDNVPLLSQSGRQCDLRAFGRGDVEGREALDALVMCGGDGLRYIVEQPDEGIAEGVEGVVGGVTHVLVGAGEDMGLKEVFTRDASKGRHP